LGREGRGREQGGEMVPTMYAHMNKRIKKNNFKNLQFHRSKKKKKNKVISLIPDTWGMI
jgi:hypothetical protein